MPEHEGVHWRDRVLDASTVVATVCVIVLTVLAARDRVLQRHARPASTDSNEAVDNWNQLVAEGRRIGPPDASLTIVEFADFECPACAAFQRTFSAFRAKHAGDVALIFRHWPLPYHKFAYSAARAAECAGDQGRFAEFHDVLYLRQDSIGLLRFTEYARRAGVPDIQAFESCVALTAPVPRIENDKTAATQIGGRGTPTIVVDGLRLVTVPDEAALETLMRNRTRHVEGH